MEAQARRDLARRVLERRGAWLAMRERAGTARRLRLTARTDAVLWLASPGPLEVGLALHHLYGFPVLPGSGLKGLAGRVAREVREPAVAEARYGGPDGAGPVAFLDGLPTGEWKVQRDVMTPHFMRWYSEESGVLPDDTESPIPIGFLAIGAGSCFEVALVARRLGDAAHLDGIVEDLRIGLEELGLGAKTAAGYGVFALEVAAGVARGAPGPPPTPARSAAADAVAAQIAALRRHEVRGRLAALVAEIERCSEHEREALAGILRQQLVALGLAGPELRDLQARYPILRGPSE
ncbi:MAG: type III-B CRISPR module RAMP protein Cmr6 [Armatimonadota bacterium]|nr:type III-B CRISPR module RAMP protein Cmr6 [Armatimonadota bacterium]MDR7528725.1 type III-B CRISPR module RAMP protein Cmr6 [Armatimonadota bacterium]